MSNALDEVLLASTRMDLEHTQSANSTLMSLSDEISRIHSLRQGIAADFGCYNERFSFELAEKLPSKIGDQLTQIAAELEKQMKSCQEKLVAHSEQLQLQKQIVNEAVESLNLVVTA